MSDRRPATTIQELDVHLGYLQVAIKDLQGTVSAMATKRDIEALAERMDTFASKDDLARLERRVNDEDAVSTLKRWASVATSIMAIVALCAATWAAVSYIVHVSDALKVVAP